MKSKEKNLTGVDKSYSKKDICFPIPRLLGERGVWSGGDDSLNRMSTSLYLKAYFTAEVSVCTEMNKSW